MMELLGVEANLQLVSKEKEACQLQTELHLQVHFMSTVEK